MKWPKLMCLTEGSIELSYTDQVRSLCEAGADWIQLRIKSISDTELEPSASICLALCRETGCRLILNDRLDLALKIGADGVHLGKQDTPWKEARQRVGSEFIIGGTVNSPSDARDAVASEALDYAGVGPFKWTATKKNLASVLTEDDWREILEILGELPVYAIGGIEAANLKALCRLGLSVRRSGLSGAAVCSVLYRTPGVHENYHGLLNTYENEITCHSR